MTKLEELRSDLAHHEASYAKCLDPVHVAHWLKFKKIDVKLLIPSYIKIIKSIKDEIASLESKQKTVVKKKTVVQTATKKTHKNE